MKKRYSYLNNSFTLIETILALIIISTILSSYLKLLSQEDLDIYDMLQKDQNKIIMDKNIINQTKKYEFNIK